MYDPQETIANAIKEFKRLYDIALEHRPNNIMLLCSINELMIVLVSIAKIGIQNQERLNKILEGLPNVCN